MPIAESVSATCGYCRAALPAAPPEPVGPEYVVCAECGSLNLRPLPNLENNAWFEGPEAVERMDRDDLARPGFLRERLRLMHDCGLARGGLVFEIGCGTGRFLEIGREAGHDVAGLELSPQLAERARSVNPDAAIHEGDILEAGGLPDSQCAAVVALDVLEHVMDPVVMLARARALLAPGGIVLIHTPNARSLRARLHGERWNMRIPEYHLHLATSRGLRAAAREAGLEVIRLRTTSGTGTGGPAERLKESALRTLHFGNGMEAVLR